MTQHWTWGTHRSETAQRPNLSAAGINPGGVAVCGGATPAAVPLKVRPVHLQKRRGTPDRIHPWIAWVADSNLSWDVTPPQYLDAVLPSVAEHKHGLCKYVQSKSMFNQTCQPVDVLAEVHGIAV